MRGRVDRRLSLGVFGTSDPKQAVPLADSLGVALQLTNILRDIREDYATGRVYLPAEDFARFGCALGADPAADPGQGKLTALVEFEADRARTWYAEGLALMPLLDRRSAASAGAMAGIYYRLLEHIAATPAAVLTRRVSLSARRRPAGGQVAGHSGGAATAPPAMATCRGARSRPVTAQTIPRTWRAGGGLAGITAAIALAETGTPGHAARIQAAPGRATCSFSRGGLTVDNGQHVFLRCCTAYRGLLARLGMTGSVTLQDRFDVTVLRPGGRARLRRTALPGPLHMGQALASYQHLSYAERLRVVPAALAMTMFTRPAPSLTGSASVTGWPLTGRANMPGGRCGTCSRSPR